MAAARRQAVAGPSRAVSATPPIGTYTQVVNTLAQLLCGVAAIRATHCTTISAQVARETKAFVIHAGTVLVAIVRTSRCHGAKMSTIAPSTSARANKARSMSIALPIWPTLLKVTLCTNPARVAKALAMYAYPIRSTRNSRTYSCVHFTVSAAVPRLAFTSGSRVLLLKSRLMANSMETAVVKTRISCTVWLGKTVLAYTRTVHT